MSELNNTPLNDETAIESASALNSEADVKADVDEIMKKYDRESNTRTFSGIPEIITKVILALFSVYTLYMNPVSYTHLTLPTKA